MIHNDSPFFKSTAIPNSEGTAIPNSEGTAIPNSEGTAMEGNPLYIHTHTHTHTRELLSRTKVRGICINGRLP